MAAPVVVSNAATVGSGQDTTLVATMPSSIAAGDRLVAFVSGAASPASATASGWTVIAGASGLSNNTDQYVTRLEKISAGGEGSTVTFTMSQSCYRQAIIVRVTGAHASTAISIASLATSNTSTPGSATVTVAEADCLLLWCCSSYNESIVGSGSPFNSASPALTATLVVESANQMVYRATPGTGATGVLTVSTTTDPHAISVVVIPPVAAATGLPPGLGPSVGMEQPSMVTGALMRW